MSARLTGLWWWIDRWRKSTAYTGMTLEEQGAYRNLLDEAALRSGPIPNDEDLLARACGDARKWKRVCPAVMSRFELHADGWHNATMDDVLTESQRRRDKQRDYRNRHGNDPGNEGGNGSGNAPGLIAGNNPRPPDPDPISLPDRSPGERSPGERRARGAGNRGGVGAGTFPGNHLDHPACGPVCFTPRMTAKFIGRFGQDFERLKAWARGVCDREQKRLDSGGAPPAFGDDFAYWTAAYNTDFGEQRSGDDRRQGERRVESVEDTDDYIAQLRRDREAAIRG